MRVSLKSSKFFACCLFLLSVYACQNRTGMGGLSHGFLGSEGSSTNESQTQAPAPIGPQESASQAGFVGAEKASFSPNRAIVEWLSFDTTSVSGSSVEELLAHSLSYLSLHSLELGIAMDEISAPSSGIKMLDEGTASLSFERRIGDVPVENAYVEMVYSRDESGLFHLRELVNRSHGDKMISNSDATMVPRGRIQEIANEQLGERDVEVSDMKESIQLSNFDPSQHEAVRSLVRVLKFKAVSPSTQNAYRITVELGSQKVLESARDIFSAFLCGKALEKNYIDAKTIDIPVSFGSYSLSGTKKSLDADGGFGADRMNQISVSLNSPMIQTYITGQTAPMAFTTDFTDSNKVLSGANASDSRGLGAFLSIQRVRKFAMQFIKSSEAPVFSTGPKLRINDSTDTGNAYFDPDKFELVFFSQGRKNNVDYANTADIVDVMFHEWGHSLDNAVGKVPGISDGSFSEGIGDIVATYMTGNPVLGIGFFLNNSTNFVRTVDNTRTYPPKNSAESEVHSQGQIIGGAFWDLRKALIDRYGPTKGTYHAGWLFFRHLLSTDAYTDSYQAVLRLDDDDGNASTNSPNHCLINKAFAKHALATDEGCTDPTVTSLPVASDLVLGIASESQGQATLAISAPQQTSVKVCMGERRDCLDPSKFKNEVAEEGTAGSKYIYVSKAQVAIAELTPVTIGKFDSAGALVAVRTFRISGK